MRRSTGPCRPPRDREVAPQQCWCVRVEAFTPLLFRPSGDGTASNPLVCTGPDRALARLIRAGASAFPMCALTALRIWALLWLKRLQSFVNAHYAVGAGAKNPSLKRPICSVAPE